MMNNKLKLMEDKWEGRTQQPQTIKVLNQSGKWISIPRDKARKAMLPGKRISKTGKVYWETRKNRSDSAMKNI